VARGLGRSGWVAGALGVSAVLAVAASEWMHWKASRRYLAADSAADLPPAEATRPSEAVIVLGYPARRNGKTHPLQRWRCQIAARSVNPEGASQMIFTGAGRGHGPSEAAVMSEYARDVLGVPSEQIALEDRARTTWQNVRFALPLAEHADTIKFASDSLHAARARRYLLAQRPELAARLRSGADYRFGERWWLKVATAGYEVVRILWRGREVLAQGGVLAQAKVRASTAQRNRTNAEVSLSGRGGVGPAG
jgi:uncharacterized SAM-binding protein YcdF (DUF218 family)